MSRSAAGGGGLPRSVRGSPQPCGWWVGGIAPPPPTPILVAGGGVRPPPRPSRISAGADPGERFPAPCSAPEEFSLRGAMVGGWGSTRPPGLPARPWPRRPAPAFRLRVSRARGACLGPRPGDGGVGGPPWRWNAARDMAGMAGGGGWPAMDGILLPFFSLRTTALIPKDQGPNRGQISLGSNRVKNKMTKTAFFDVWDG